MDFPEIDIDAIANDTARSTVDEMIANYQPPQKSGGDSGGKG